MTQLEAENQSLRHFTQKIEDDDSEGVVNGGISKASLTPIFEENDVGGDERDGALTDAQLAKILGVNQSTVSRWRKGKNKPSGDYEDIFDEWKVKGDRWYRINNNR